MKLGYGRGEGRDVDLMTWLAKSSQIANHDKWRCVTYGSYCARLLHAPSIEGGNPFFLSVCVIGLTHVDCCQQRLDVNTMPWKLPPDVHIVDGQRIGHKNRPFWEEGREKWERCKKERFNLPWVDWGLLVLWYGLSREYVPVDKNRFTSGRWNAEVAIFVHLLCYYRSGCVSPSVSVRILMIK